MINDKLDITSLKNAVQALRKSIDVYEKNRDEDIDLSDTLRSGVIQTYDGIVAEGILKTAIKFLPYANDFITRLEQRL
jgi:hypothetical protein